jgi:hypothetical protein
MRASGSAGPLTYGSPEFTSGRGIRENVLHQRRHLRQLAAYEQESNQLLSLAIRNCGGIDKSQRAMMCSIAHCQAVPQSIGHKFTCIDLRPQKSNASDGGERYRREGGKWSSHR